MYVFKTFKSLCKNENVDNEKLCEEVVKLTTSLMTDKVRQQAFDYIITSKHMTQTVIVEFLKNMQTILKEKGNLLLFILLLAFYLKQIFTALLFQTKVTLMTIKIY